MLLANSLIAAVTLPNEKREVMHNPMGDRIISIAGPQKGPGVIRIFKIIGKTRVNLIRLVGGNHIK